MKVIGFVGESGSGKTTLMAGLIDWFVRAGLRVAAVKHAHHGFDIDRPGKDSHRFRAAGAAQVLLASDERWVLMSEEQEGDPDGALARHLARLAPCDLVLVEGFRGETSIPFIEVRRVPDPDPDHVHRPAGRAARLPPAGRIALASDVPLGPQAEDAHLPELNLNDVESIAHFIADTLELKLC